MDSLLYLLLVSFIATLVRATFGFGESLIAVPLFLLFLPVKIAVPLSVLLSVVIALVVLLQDRKEVALRPARWLIFSAIPGIPLGIFMLVAAGSFWIRIGIGTLLIVYSAYTLFSGPPGRLIKDHPVWLLGCGLLSGVLGGAYGLNGPPLVVYGSKRRWSARRFRATLQAYFLPVSLLTVIGYAFQGLFSTTVFRLGGIALLAVLPAIFLGRYINRRLKGKTFFTLIFTGLILLGILLILVTLNRSEVTWIPG